MVRRFPSKIIRGLTSIVLISQLAIPAMAQVNTDPPGQPAAMVVAPEPQDPASTPPAQTVTAPPAVTSPQSSVSKPDVNNPAKQAGAVLKDVTKGDVKALRRGPLLVHGNFCGIGNRPGAEPTDALDEACMHHDACTTEGKMPSCACNDRLREEAMAISQDPRTPPKIQALATTMAASMVILICK